MSHDAAGVCDCVVTHTPRPAELHVHHVWPLAWGGPDAAANRVWLCLLPDTPVLMADGTWRPITSVRVGDVVVGGDGLPDLVIGTTHRPHSGAVVHLGRVGMTPDHLVATRRGWIPAGALRENDEARFYEPVGECVEPHVLRLVSAQPQVDGAVVVRDQVDVVDDFGLRQTTPDHFLHDSPGAFDYAPRRPVPQNDEGVALLVSPAGALPLGGSRDSVQCRHPAGVGAKARRSSAAPCSGSIAPERPPTFLAGNERPRLPSSTSGALGAARLDRVRRGDQEHLPALDAPPFRHDAVASLKAWRSAFDHRKTSTFHGDVYDITILRSESFVAGGLVVHNCPTSHVNVHELLAAYRRAGGLPSWEVRRAFSPFTRALAARGWAADQGAT